MTSQMRLSLSKRRAAFAVVIPILTSGLVSFLSHPSALSVRALPIGAALEIIVLWPLFRRGQADRLLIWWTLFVILLLAMAGSTLTGFTLGPQGGAWLGGGIVGIAALVSTLRHVPHVPHIGPSAIRKMRRILPERGATWRQVILDELRAHWRSILAAAGASVGLSILLPPTRDSQLQVMVGVFIIMVTLAPLVRRIRSNWWTTCAMAAILAALIFIIGVIAGSAVQRVDVGSVAFSYLVTSFLLDLLIIWLIDPEFPGRSLRGYATPLLWLGMCWIIIPMSSRVFENRLCGWPMLGAALVALIMVRSSRPQVFGKPPAAYWMTVLWLSVVLYPAALVIQLLNTGTTGAF